MLGAIIGDIVGWWLLIVITHIYFFRKNFTKREYN
jgi:hypothetical protein